MRIGHIRGMLWRVLLIIIDDRLPASIGWVTYAGIWLTPVFAAPMAAKVWRLRLLKHPDLVVADILCRHGNL